MHYYSAVTGNIENLFKALLSDVISRLFDSAGVLLVLVCPE